MPNKNSYLALSDPQDEQESPRILLAEDDDDMRRLLAGSLRRIGCEVMEARNGADLLCLISSRMLGPHEKCPIDLVITDVRMPFATGLEVLAALRERICSTPVILITAFGDEVTHAEARRLGAVAVFDKPFQIDDLHTAVRYYLGGRLDGPDEGGKP